MPYLSEQVEYYNRKPSDVAQYDTVTFEADDIPTIRLVANQPFDKTFQGQVYRGVKMSVPSVAEQTSETSKQGTLVFGRIGNELIPVLRNRDPLQSSNPIKATLRLYKEGVTEPIYQRVAYVPNDGISYDADSVNIKLAMDNPSKLSIPSLSYDPTVWRGLILV